MVRASARFVEDLGFESRSGADIFSYMFQSQNFKLFKTHCNSAKQTKKEIKIYYDFMFKSLTRTAEIGDIYSSDRDIFSTRVNKVKVKKFVVTRKNESSESTEIEPKTWLDTLCGSLEEKQYSSFLLSS